jgi:hypothetical protein
MARSFSQDVTEYDENIARLVGKLQQYPEKNKLKAELGHDFQMANQADLNTINGLKATGQPDIWYGIYQANDRIDKRQDLVMSLPEKTIREAGFQFIDISRDLEESKNRATYYSYAFALKMLADTSPVSARKAYIELLKVVRLQDGSYKDLDKLMRKAILNGSTSMEFALVNKSGQNLTSDIIGRLDKIVWDYKRARIGQQETVPSEIPFKFILRVVINEIDVSGDQVKELNYQEERDLYSDEEVVDTIKCLVYEYRQLKKATMIGRIDFYDVQLGQVVNIVPINVESVFTNSYGTLQGNPDAAGDATKMLLDSKKADYPSAEQMILDATDEFVVKARQIVLVE